jgi:hypothetical protein
MQRSSNVFPLERPPAEREMVVIRLTAERKDRRLRTRLDTGRAGEAGLVLVTLALVALLFVCLQHAVEGPPLTASPPPGAFVMPVGP